jgi:alkylated DNA repair dioxygenase AlkB
MQSDLFKSSPSPPEGFRYSAEFVSAVEEARLLKEISSLPLTEASYREWTAKRRIVSYGGRYDFTHNRLLDAEPMPQFLEPLRQQVARWVQMPAQDFTHVMIAEYRPGTQLGWHRDVPNFEVVIGVSLKGRARMRFRPYPPSAKVARATHSLDLAPRSAYIMRGPVRWQSQHAISPTKEQRYSITFRTLAHGQ